MREIWLAALAASATNLWETPARAGAPQLGVEVTSSDQVGVQVARAKKGRGVSAVIGMWSDDGALELGGFRDGPTIGMDPGVARAAQIVSGKSMRSTGVRLSGAFHRTGALSLTVEARRQRVSDVGAAMAGGWRSAGDSRLTLGGRLKF